MLYICMHKANAESEADAPPRPEVMEGMGPLMESMIESGVLVAGEGLRPTSTGVRLRFEGGVRQVQDGPFGGPSGCLAGFTIVRTANLDEAIEWASRLACLGDVELDVRPVAEPWDVGFGPKPDDVTTTRYLITRTAPSDSDGEPSRRDQDAALNSVLAEMTQAGVLLASESFPSSAQGARLDFVAGKRAVTDGPFAESKEVIAGYAIMRAATLDEAIDWSSRFAAVVGDVEIDILPLVESSVPH